MPDRLLTDTLQALRDVNGSLAWATREFARLDLLESTESTVEWCASQQRAVETFIGLFRSLSASLEKLPPDVHLDPDDNAVGSLQRAEDGVRDLYAELRQRRQSVLGDPDLRGDHESSILAEYEKLCALLKELHTLCRDCRWLIMNHDARLDESNGETFSNPEELIAGLNAE